MPNSAVATRLLCPFALSVDRIARFLNAEFPDHPVYDGIELQWFDDDVHGTGMLAFLSRREDRRVDYYFDAGLTLDRAAYAIGGGTGEWVETEFDAALLEVSSGGVAADVRFTDVEGRSIEIAVDDRGTGRRHSSELLAPVGSAIEKPISLMLVYLHRFDLLRKSACEPRIRIDGKPVKTGKLPGELLHRRHLIKAAAPLTVATVCQERAGSIDRVEPDRPGPVVLNEPGTGIAGMHVGTAEAGASLRFEPPFPALDFLPERTEVAGNWSVGVDGAPITGGTWHAIRHGRQAKLGLEVTRPWQLPPGTPALMRLVTRAVPVFRQWPTTYRWAAEVDLDTETMESRWERTETGGSEQYRRATGS